MLPWNVSVHVIEPGIFSKTGLYDQFQTGLDKLWEECSDEVKDAYGQDYYQFVRKNMGTALDKLGNTNSNLVPEAMMHALTSKSPQYRYRVGFDSKYLITLVENLHESVQDEILTGSEDKVVLPKKAPKNGKKLVQQRYKGSNYKYYFLALILFLLYRRIRG